MKRLLPAVVFVLSWTALSLGQPAKSSPSLSISVRDPTGAPIPNAHVTVVNEAVPKTSQTDSKGTAVFELPRPGYVIVVTASGFNSQTRAISASDSEKQKMDFVLSIGSGGGVEVSRTQGDEEDQVWGLEQSYWEYVQRFDLQSYRKLWNDDFIGWPFVSPAPVGVAHITDWIEGYRSRGLRLDSFRVLPQQSRHYDKYVLVYYLISARWLDKDGKGESSTSRITHTWMKSDKGWQIISGMSAAVASSK